ncbi:bifunctional glycosyltransferase/CDP-glycerol:glycerophosphate glycerophosphotransferase [Cytobacillus kochii]|uniref:bifunctional glycosyltransferase/CDP-glycerol:glycerophosphate glycerophosphotransferase n=1 Tax=Cytobacillus kochii TaxID=859143 RepID=UPI00203E3349|nr:CDP-glycerol glycerophosphotransferase family protein [Cytobacillus kochii]MCM3322733.1 bifunctional glycosyltransferase family 2 protein/CDP-glycerol:glycerophosphate glycerophosphotransferase [Cytobacillus kochii]MCM3344788.1 bifunctional glycosyltransferase family 2 protein/CDP-glycerol:glycerophosphate glycerophosphotransferase [Cytobacillus kochii]
MEFDISVIIPTYNVELYIDEALNSVKKQSFMGSVEVIIIDDCSTDKTHELIEEFKRVNDSKSFSIKTIYQEKNMRQGTARNRGIEESNGKYIFFLDGDDILDSSCFEKMFDKAIEGSYDFVLCDWAYYYEDKGLVYVNNDLFLNKQALYNIDCEQLYEAPTYFSVNKLYLKEFLINNNIRYGEGYIYEDFEFYLDVAQKANAIAIISNPLYWVRVNEHSTTKTNTMGTDHITSYLKAVENSIKLFNPRGKSSYYQVYKHLIQKSIYYAKKRAPIGYKRKTLKKVISILNTKNKHYYVPLNIIPLNHLLFRRRYVQRSKVNRILFVDWLQSKGKLVPIFKIAKKYKNKIKYNKLTDFIRNTNYYKNKKKHQKLKKIESFNNRAIKENSILFLGFDYRYIGNSRYFFEYLQERKSQFEIHFVTKDNRVPSEFRITPRSMKFYEKLATSKIVIGESWLPLDFKKRQGAYWLQMWHGTPYKKLLFDSHEMYISKYNRNHKKQKQRDIMRWDFLLSDSPKASEKFISAFVIPKEKILNFGYPRVQWLKSNQENTELIESIKKGLNIPIGKKVILYVPTWRDYNFKSHRPDNKYKLDLNNLLEKLNDDYVVIDKDHSMSLGSKEVNSQVININPSSSIDVQELILISDIIISDYSSIIFDGLAINKKFLLYINDFEQYEKARGVYSDINEQLLEFNSTDVETLANKITILNSEYPNVTYEKVKSVLANIYTENSNLMLENFIQKLMNSKE